MLSSYHGHVPLTRYLLASRANANVLNDRGQSPLAGAVFKNEREIIEVLLDGGADPRLGTPSALEATVDFKQEEYREWFEDWVKKQKR
jgi:ankyrin repeat protein